MQRIISGIQQIGIGIPDVYKAWEWYRKAFGMNVPIFDEAATAALMLPYTGGKPRERHAVLAINLQGGGGFEIWQYKNRKPQAPDFEIQAGDLGIFSGKIKTPDINKAYKHLKKINADLIGEISENPIKEKHFFVKDPYNNIFEVIENNIWFNDKNKATGGPFGAVIGVNNIDKSLNFYKNILGFDKLLYDETKKFEDLKLIPGGNNTFRRAIITHSEKRKGAFSELFGQGYIEMLQVEDREARTIFENRLWGDLGFIHLCFDINGMASFREYCKEQGHPFTVDTGDSFDMGEAAGAFAYIEDPDGTLIEFVETHKIPIIKKIGWYLNLSKRNPEKPLPKWLLNALRFVGKKD